VTAWLTSPPARCSPVCSPASIATPVRRFCRLSRRGPFQALLDYLEGGQTLDEFIDDFPTVTREAAVAALELAKSVLVGRLG